MTKQEIVEQIGKKKSLLCVGLDTDITKIPKYLLELEDPVFEFNKKIINATADYSIAFKLNTAFYESMGINGWSSLDKTIKYINENYPEIFSIADAKRGDIGNTSKMYASAFLEKMNFDSITVSPYMGEDSVKPFLEYKDKWIIILGLTSNIGASDFQFQKVENKELYKMVIEKTSIYGNHQNTMYVVGATKSEFIKEIRKIIPSHFLLVPGIGAQGGNLENVCKYGLNKDFGLIINSSRSIIYADNTENFDFAAMKEAKKIQKKISELL